MKKFTFILTVLVAMAIKTNAQIPNNGFENWKTVNSYDTLSGWGSTNYLSAGSFYAVTKSIDHYPATVGNYSIRIENNTALLPKLSGYGIALTGAFGAGKNPVFPIIGHPTSLTGYYKYAPQNGDTMTIDIRLFLNGIEIFKESFYQGDLTSYWTSFNITFPIYANADSAYIAMSPTLMENLQKIHGNSVLYIDNLNFDNLISSVPEQSVKNTLFNFYPNPASDIVTLKTGNTDNAYMALNIYSVIGTLVKSEILGQNNRQINIGDLSNGIYMITIKSKDTTKTEKLVIQH